MMESSQSLRSEEGWKRESGWEKTGLEWNMDSLILWDSYTKYLSYLFVCYKKVSITGTKRCIDNYVQTKCLQFFLLTPNIFMDSEISKEWSSQAKEANPHLKPPGLLDVSQSSRLLSLAPQMWTLTKSLPWRLPPLCLLFFHEWHKWIVLQSQATMCMSIHRWMGKQIVVQLDHGVIVHNSKKDWTVDIQQHGEISNYSG